MMNSELLSFVSLILLIIGGINLGLMGLFDVNLISAILGHFLSRLLFIAIGAAAGYMGYIKFSKKTV